MIKYRHKEGMMVLKITDNTHCFVYKTNQLADVKELVKLNSKLVTVMSSKHLEAEVNNK
jgi:hypothetical protein